VQGINSADLEGSKVLLRTDINLPVEDGEPRPTVRFKRYMETVRQLREEDAKTVIVAHQGRPARDDFLSLEPHSELIEEELDADVRFIPSFFGGELDETLESMENGDIALVQNVRMLSEELQNISPERHSNDFFVQQIAPKFDLYVNDAFSAAHRSHGSLVGFNSHLDSYAGPVMKRELDSCGEARDSFETGTLVLGGEKPSDVIGMMEQMIESVDRVLLGGIPGELALIIQGEELGEKKDWISERGFDSGKEKLESLLNEYPGKITVPGDVRTPSGNYAPGDVPEDEMTWDIGGETADRYAEIIEGSEAVVMKGPMGAFEDHEEGTRKILNAVADSDGYTVIGGGHTSSLVHRFDRELDEFDHVSIAGGAFVRFMSGEELAAVEALKEF
jgi:phosphoglycerate kinase